VLKKRLIPSLLLKNGRCVKTVRFGEFRDVGNPVTAARVYDAQGADELLFLDISASVEGRETLFEIVEAVASSCFMPLTVGGGVRTVEDIRRLLSAGADKVLINTAALKRPAFIEEAATRFGSQCVVAGIDFRRVEDGCAVFGLSGREAAGREPVAWARELVKHGAGEIFLNSIDRDGTMEGYDVEAIAAVADAVTVPVIAAGGAGTLHDLVACINVGHASAVSVASVFHFTDQNVIKAKAFMRHAGVDVRAA
jgi:cyclase